MTAISPHITRATGTILTAAIYNADHVNHVNNANALNNDKIESVGSITPGNMAVFLDDVTVEDGGPPSTATGDVVGPASAVDERLARFNGTTGKLLEDSGVLVTTVGAGKQTIWLPALSMVRRTTNGAAVGTGETATNRVMRNTLDFDTTTQEFAQFVIEFPKSWNLGTITFQPVWSHAAAVTNFGVAWGLAAVAISNDDPLEVAFGTAVTSVDTGGTTDDVYVGPESAAITIAGTPALNDVVFFQINRTVADAGDTLAVDARLHGIRIFYTTNANTDA